MQGTYGDLCGDNIGLVFVLGQLAGYKEEIITCYQLAGYKEEIIIIITQGFIMFTISFHSKASKGAFINNLSDKQHNAISSFGECHILVGDYGFILDYARVSGHVYKVTA